MSWAAVAAMSAATAAGTGIYGAVKGGPEYEQPEWYEQPLPPGAAPTRVPGREADIFTKDLPQYPWAKPLLGGGAQYLQNIMGSIGRGEVPGYLQKMGEAIREPAVAELETGFGRAAGLMGETLAGRGMKLTGGAGQAGARALGGEFARARGGLEQDIARQMFGETAGLARQLPAWLGTYGQIRPPVATMGVQPTEQWWSPMAYGWQGAPAQGGYQPTGGAGLGESLAWLRQGQQTQTPTQTQFAPNIYGTTGVGPGGGYDFTQDVQFNY